MQSPNDQISLQDFCHRTDYIHTRLKRDETEAAAAAAMLSTESAAMPQTEPFMLLTTYNSLIRGFMLYQRQCKGCEVLEPEQSVIVKLHVQHVNMVFTERD